MIAVLIVAFFVIVLVVLISLRAISRAADGYEDATGFHFGKPIAPSVGFSKRKRGRAGPRRR